MRRVCRLFMLCTLVSALASSVVHAQDSSTQPAQTSIEAWLSLVDAHSYAASWDTAASIFKSAVPQEKWSAAVEAARTPLGKLKSRTLKGATAVKPPSAPAGDYLIFQYDTSFEQRSGVMESVTAFKEKDGTWRVAGYFVK